MATYTVKRGDCLWNIAKSELGNATRWKEIANLNGISTSKPTIYPGDVLQLPGGSSSTTTSKSTANCPTDLYLDKLAGTDTLFVTWKWDKEYTKEYQVRWEYWTLNKRWFRASDNDSTTTLKEATYGPPDNAVKVRVKIKPISTTKKVNDEEVERWTADWSSYKEYDLSDTVLSVPSSLSAELDEVDDLKLKMRLDNLANDATHIIFEITQDDTKVVKTTGKTDVKIVTSSASYEYKVSEGHTYKVRCRAYDSGNNLYSEWSSYSNNVGTKPLSPKSIKTCRAEDENTVYLEWESSATAVTYDIEYATNRNYFDVTGDTTTINGITGTVRQINELETGLEYFFRVRAVGAGTSKWTDIVSVILGTQPTAPTTWSSTTTGIVGETVTLHWVHNSEDESLQTYAEICISVDGVDSFIQLNTTHEADDSKTMFYELDTDQFTEGTQILWDVRTAGILKTSNGTPAYGDWSVQRTIDIYARPTLDLDVQDAAGNSVANSSLTSFPLYIFGTTGPATQTPIGYHVSISSGSSYETIDSVGNSKTVIAGEDVYSRYYDTDEQLVLELSAGGVDLENGVEYTVTCIASTNSGLTVTETATFTVSWTDEQYPPNAEIGINSDDVSAYIRPYCEDENGDLMSGVRLAVYRREYDGTFVEIASGIDNLSGTYVTDPHPALDYARYRIVATMESTGAVSYYDMPAYPIQEKAIVLQWNETWTNFEIDTEDALSESPVNGSMLKLLYNVDVSEKKSLDTSLVKYVGRKHPVSYYGTHVGEAADWKTVIPKTDTRTLYALRKLSVWMGDVYVREPSGSGYWASISVSFNQTHSDPTIPVSLAITRVEGGV